MADLSITAANVAAGGNARTVTGTAGATITAGQVVALAADGKYQLADNDSATAELRSPYGIALHGSLSGQPLTVLRSGKIKIGATTAVGTVYVLSSTAGAICPAADLGSGDYTTIIGLGVSTTRIDVKFHEAGGPVA